MAKYTLRYGLYLPSRFDKLRIDETLSENFSKIDNALSEKTTIIEGDVEPPETTPEGTLWLDKSGEGFQGTLFEGNFNKIKDDLEIHSTQLAKTTTHARKFRPSFGVAPWFLSSASGSLESAPRLNIENQMRRMKEFGAEEYSMIVHVRYNSANNSFDVIQNLDDMLWACDKAKEIGLGVSMVKFHTFGITASIINENSNTFQTQWKQFLTLWADGFKNKGIPYFTVLNEAANIYLNSNFETFVLDCIAIPKVYGFKVGLSTMNYLECVNLSSAIKNAVDGFFVNAYPTVSYNRNKSTVEEAVNAWDTTILGFRQLKIEYPTKFIVMSETGCQDYWEALSSPGKHDWNTVSGTMRSYGEAPNLFLISLFESDVKHYVEKVVYWYYDAIHYENAKKTILHYIVKEGL